jgi:hypothetical protein
LTVAAVVVVLLAKVVAALALLPRRGWTDPRVVVLLATSAAGWGAYVLLGHSGLSQAAFAKATALPLCVAATWGLSRLVSAVPVPRLRATVTGSALAIGAALTAAMWGWWLTPYTEDMRGSWRDFVAPPVIVVIVVSLTALAVALLVPRIRRYPALIALSICLALIGSGALMAVQTVGAVAKGWGAPHSIRLVLIGDGGLEAARWVRAHSSPDDVLATNEHQTPHTKSNRAFWLAAQAERRVLVEGWGYTEKTNSRYHRTAVQNLRAPFWDADLLATNDAAFTRPSYESVGRLADRYDVRWLVLNGRLPSRSNKLARFADLRFSSGDYTVYEVPR